MKEYIVDTFNVCIRASYLRSSAVVKWLEGSLDCRLQEPGFESYTAVPYTEHVFFSLHCSNLLSYMNWYLTIDSDEYVCTNSVRALIAA